MTKVRKHRDVKLITTNKNLMAIEMKKKTNKSKTE